MSNIATIETVIAEINTMVDEAGYPMVTPWMFQSLAYSAAGGYVNAQRYLEQANKDIGLLSGKERDAKAEQIKELEARSDAYLDMFNFIWIQSDDNVHLAVHPTIMFEKVFREPSVEHLEMDEEKEAKLARKAKRSGRTIEQERARMERRLREENREMDEEAKAVGKWNRANEDRLVKALVAAGKSRNLTGFELSDRHYAAVLGKLDVKLEQYYDSLERMSDNFRGRVSRARSKAADTNLDLLAPIQEHVGKLYHQVMAIIDSTTDGVGAAR